MKPSPKLSLWAAALILTLLLTACPARTKTPVLQEHKPTVYTSIYPLFDFTQKIAGDRANVISLLPPGAEPHSFEPTTRSLSDLGRANLFIYNGAGMEPYLPKLTKALEGKGVLLVNASQGLALLPAEEAGEEREEAHRSEEWDPHVWLSPLNAQKQAENILKALQDLDPPNSSYFQANFLSLSSEFTKLDREFQDTLQPSPQKELVISHAAFAYLCKDYGLTQRAVMGVNAEAEPTPGRVKEIIQNIRKSKLSCIYVDLLDSVKLPETIARETGTSILYLNSLANLRLIDLEAGRDYFMLMRDNLQSLKKGLAK